MYSQHSKMTQDYKGGLLPLQQHFHQGRVIKRVVTPTLILPPMLLYSGLPSKTLGASVSLTELVVTGVEHMGPVSDTSLFQLDVPQL